MPSAPVSERKRLANRLNAQKSTGPRSERGKAICAGNALKHGVFAQKLLLGGEDPAELMRLKCGIVRRLNPRDALEVELVTRIVITMWKLRRMQNIERAVFVKEGLNWAEAEPVQRERNGLGDGDSPTPQTIWAGSGPHELDRLQRIEKQEHRLETTLNRMLREWIALRKLDAPAELSEVAAELIEQEQAAVTTQGVPTSADAPNPPPPPAFAERNLPLPVALTTERLEDKDPDTAPGLVAAEVLGGASAETDSTSSQQRPENNRADSVVHDGTPSVPDCGLQLESGEENAMSEIESGGPQRTEVAGTLQGLDARCAQPLTLDVSCKHRAEGTQAVARSVANMQAGSIDGEPVGRYAESRSTERNELDEMQHVSDVADASPGWRHDPNVPAELRQILGNIESINLDLRRPAPSTEKISLQKLQRLLSERRPGTRPLKDRPKIS